MTSSGTDTGGSSHPPCEQYLACVAVVSPDALPTAESTFGPMGTCWDSSPEVLQGCLDSCASGLSTFGMVYPDEPACGGGGGTTGEPTGTTTESGVSTEPTGTTEPVFCQDSPGRPDGADCSDSSGCGCKSGACFLIPAVGGVCGECLGDADCDGGGCTAPNLFGGVGGGSQCNAGGPGDGCQSDAVCSDPSNDVCGEVMSVPGIITISTCGECETNADCGGQTPVCAPKYDLAKFGGRFDCVAAGSVANGGGCQTNAACASGHCGEVSAMGLLKFTVCGECLSDNDCGPGEQCYGGSADLNVGKLTGATCQ
ncbi:hypothetical protein [Nannocystis bainbridge]|uniref:hypothetical protein n=1 Tax=Nannocystis bainbridge TaxID=2995303 RepID=UPI00232AF0A7|nr:hypothetical protein [Nannocystis bainbridge]